jgi:hypothetical protein
MAHRAVLALMITIVMAAGAQAQTNPAKSKGTDVSGVFTPLFDTYCTTCHNQTRKTANLALDTLKTTDVSENTAVWEKVLRRLRTRRDPPIGAPRPEEAAYQSAIAAAETALDHAYPMNAVLTNTNRASDAELGERMAKLIWNGTPDSLLLNAVKKGDLRKPAGLEQQVRRMLQDPKANNLVTGFFERWLLGDLLEKAQGADEDLRTALGTETRLFLESQIHEDHNALDLWTANYTFLNDNLARHYGISGISGSEFRKYTFPDNKRAGILGQGSFLTITSFKDRTSPVTRGKVVLTTFLGVAPPDPAPNVPPLKPNDDHPMRVRMQAHLTNPACVNCHATFDPVGFALENFNRVGQWRSTDGGETIDPSGAFVDGTKFNGPAELREGLLKYRAAYYSNITQKLLGYALGRQGRNFPVHDNEMPAVRAAVREAAGHDYRWSSIVAGIVKSSPFQMKTVSQ